LETAEIDQLLTYQSFAITANDFYVAVELVMRTLLQDLEFVYRIEAGTPVEAGLVQLTPYELGARIAFTLTGSAPDAALLDSIAAGQLDSAEGVRTTAETLLADPRAVERIGRFHALWLSYEKPLLDDAELRAAARQESDALIARIVFTEDRPWQELFTSDQAFIDARLAGIYGETPPAAPAWVTLTDPNRRGLLGQSSFLSGGAKFGDTSLVLRGIQVRERLLCQKIPSPPPTVDADVPPEGGPDDCKTERYAAHRALSCAGCHLLLDPIGEGLENYDAVGAFRQIEKDRAECVIAGLGEIQGVGPLENPNLPFSGPAQLAAAVLSTGKLDDCVMQQYLQFLVGRPLDLTSDGPMVAALATRFESSEFRLKRLLTELISSTAFRHRVTEQL
jgi:hypothetical protein